MPFDPDQYLAAKTSGGFDPDAYLSGKGGMGMGADIAQEMHPAFSTTDRLVVKNLANDNQSAVKYLKQKHPDLEIKVDDYSGEIIAKGKGEKDWKVLDPDTGFFSTDFLQDVGDVSGDIATGIGTTAATAAGGVMGGLPGAMAGGAVSSAALEALRQAAGQAAGVPQDMDWGSVRTSAVIGGLSPLIFGTGATTTQVAKKAAGDTLGAMNPFAGALATLKGEAAPVLDEAGKELLKSQRGLIGRGWDLYRNTLAPKLGSMSTGVPEQAIKTMRDNPELLSQMDAKGALGYIDDATRKNVDKVVGESTRVGQALEGVRTEASNLVNEFSGLPQDQIDALAKAAGLNAGPDLLGSLQVDVTKAQKPLMDLWDELVEVAGKSGSQADLDAVGEVAGVIKDYFGQEKLPLDAAFQLRQHLDELGKRSKVAQGTAQGLAPSTSPFSKRVITKAREAAKIINEEMDRVGQVISGQDGIAQGNARYAQIQRDRAFLKKFTKDPETAYRNLSNLAQGKPVTREILTRIDQEYGTDFLKQADNLAAYKHFSKAPFEATSGGGTTSTSRTIPAAMLGGGIGYYIGANSGLGQGGAGIGAGIGAPIGALLGGPKALRAYMALQRAGTRAATTARNVGLRPNQVVPTWLLMEQQARENRP